MSDKALRSHLIHVAAELPKGSSGRKALLEVLAVDARIIRDFERMNKRNDRNGALLALAKFLGARKHEQIMVHIIGISDLLGYNLLTDFRYSEVYKPLMAIAKRKFDPETYAQIHGAF